MYVYIYILASAIKFLEMGGYPKWRGSVFEMGGGLNPSTNYIHNL